VFPGGENNGVRMKKIVFIAVFIRIGLVFAGFEFINLPQSYNYGYTEMSDRNMLAVHAHRLDKIHGIKAIVYKTDTADAEQLRHEAYGYFDNREESAEGRLILVYFNPKIKAGSVIVSPGLRESFSEEHIRIIEEDSMKALFGRWYISERRALGKIMGSFVYLLEKDTLSKRELEKLARDAVFVDEPLLGIAVKQPFRDLLKLFYFEPVSFIFYFPFLMYLLVVRFLMVNFGKNSLKAFISYNLIWLGIVGFVFTLAVKKTAIYFPEYIAMLSLFMAVNAPVYLFFGGVLSRDIQNAAHKYLYEVTGGFEGHNAFEGREWK